MFEWRDSSTTENVAWGSKLNRPTPIVAMKRVFAGALRICMIGYEQKGERAGERENRW